MNTNYLTESDLFWKISGMIKNYGSQKAVAELLGISVQYLNDYLGGRRNAGAKMLAAMELRRVVMYESTFTNYGESE